MFSSPRSFASKFFFLYFAAMPSFFFRWRKERERIETVGMIAAICECCD